MPGWAMLVKTLEFARTMLQVGLDRENNLVGSDVIARAANDRKPARENLPLTTVSRGFSA
jgi:hypothetical protein